MKKALFAFLTCLLLASLPMIHLEAATVTGSTLVSYFDATNHVNQTLTGEYGSIVYIEPPTNSGYNFAFWVVNGVVRNDLSASSQLFLTNNLEVKAIFAPDGQYAALFMDSNGHLLKVDYFDPAQTGPADEVVPPSELPTKPGNTIAENPWGAGVNFSSLTQHMVYTLQYVQSWTNMVSITVVNGTGSGSYLINSLVTAVADAAPGEQVFSHWEREGFIVSYDQTYTFTALTGTTVTAIYAASAPSDTFAAAISYKYLRTGYNSFVGQFDLPSGYELVEWGIITSDYQEDTESSTFNLNSSWITKYQSNRYNATTNEFIISIPEVSYTSARVYVVAKSGETLYYKYSHVEAYQKYANVYEYADYTSQANYDAAVTDSWIHTGTTFSTTELALDSAGDNVKSTTFSAWTGPLTVTIPMRVTVADTVMTNTFSITAYDVSNNLVESSGNITLTYVGLTTDFSSYHYVFENLDKNISYVVLTYNKETTGNDICIQSITIGDATPIRPTSMSVTGAVSTIATAGTVQLTAKASPEGAPSTVNWSSSSSSIASVNSSGLVTGVSAGTVTIYATSTIDSTVIGSFEVTVVAP